MGDPQIYIRGFSKSTSQDELRTAFSAFGQIKEVRMIRDYAFIVYYAEDSASKAVSEMNGKEMNEQRVKVQIAGQPKKPKGPQPNDECRYCGRKGHWKNDCPDLRKQRRRRRSRSRSRGRSQSSDSSSSSSSVAKKKKKIKKHKGKSKRRRSSSSSSSSYSSSASSKQTDKKQTK